MAEDLAGLGEQRRRALPGIRDGREGAGIPQPAGRLCARTGGVEPAAEGERDERDDDRAAPGAQARAPSAASRANGSRRTR